jgi:hypothetical protein
MINPHDGDRIVHYAHRVRRRYICVLSEVPQVSFCQRRVIMHTAPRHLRTALFLFTFPFRLSLKATSIWSARPVRSGTILDQSLLPQIALVTLTK